MGTVPVSQVREDVVIAYKKEVEWQADQKLLPYKNMCARRKVCALYKFFLDYINRIEPKNVKMNIVFCLSTGGCRYCAY